MSDMALGQCQCVTRSFRSRTVVHSLLVFELAQLIIKENINVMRPTRVKIIFSSTVWEAGSESEIATHKYWPLIATVRERSTQSFIVYNYLVSNHHKSVVHTVYITNEAKMKKLRVAHSLGS